MRELIKKYRDGRCAPALLGAAYLLFLFYMTIEGHRAMHLMLLVLIAGLIVSAFLLLIKGEKSSDQSSDPSSDQRWNHSVVAPGMDLLTLIGLHLPFYIAAFFADHILESDWRYTSQIPTYIMRVLAELFLVEGTIALISWLWDRMHGMESRYRQETGSSRRLKGEKDANGSHERKLIFGPGSYAAAHKEFLRFAFFGSFIICYLYRFFLTTTFTSIAGPFSSISACLMRIAVMVLLVVYVFAIPGIQNAWQLLFSLVILLIGFLYKANDGKYAVFMLCVFIVASTGQNALSILRAAFITGLAFLLASLLCSQTGLITDFTYSLKSRGRVVQHAFGIIYYTDCSAHWMYLTAMYVMIRNARKRWLRWADILIAAGMLAFNVILIRGRANIICIILLILIMLADNLKLLRIPGKGKVSRAVRWILSAPVIMIYPILTVLSRWIVYYYKAHKKHIPYQKLLKKFTSVKSLKWRCWYVARALKKYSIKLFGNVIEERGVAGNTKLSKRSFFIDNSYMRMLIICGVAFLLVFLAVMVVLQFRLVRNHLIHWALALFVIAVSGVIEHHLIDPGYNVFPMLVFAVLPGISRINSPGTQSGNNSVRNPVRE